MANRFARLRMGCLAVLLACGAAAWADGGGGGGSGEANDDASQPDYTAGIDAINKLRWNDATTMLRRHVLARDRHADGHNWLAFAYRKSGRLDEAFRHYRRALGLDPQHLGAHEYIGEAYLAAGKPQDAERHLKRLAELCGSQCEQYKDLQRALAEFTARR